MRVVNIQEQFDLKYLEVQLTDDVIVKVANNVPRVIIILDKFNKLRDKEQKEIARAKMEGRKPNLVASFGDYADLLRMLFKDEELEKIFTIEGFDMEATVNLITTVTSLVLGQGIKGDEVNSELPN